MSLNSYELHLSIIIADKIAEAIELSSENGKAHTDFKLVIWGSDIVGSVRCAECSESIFELRYSPDEHGSLEEARNSLKKAFEIARLQLSVKGVIDKKLITLRKAASNHKIYHNLLYRAAKKGELGTAYKSLLGTLYDTEVVAQWVDRHKSN